MSGGPGAATTVGPYGEGGSGEWRRIYDRVEALLPRVEELAADRARLEESNRTQQELSEAREKSLHARLLQAEASRMRWKTAYIELPLLANPKIAELQENDLEDSRKCKALLDVDIVGLEIQLKRARRHVELTETNVGYEDIVKDLRAELTKLRQAYETLSTNKDKEATEAAQKLQQNIEELQLAARKKDDEIDRLRAKAFDAENKLKAMKKDKTALLKIKEVEGAQATEAKHKLQKNVEELQVAARDKDDEIRRLRAEGLAAKNKLLVAEDKLDEIQKLEDGQLESLKRKRTSLPNASIIYMDFLSFPALAPNEHTINYGILRICFVCNADFQLAVAIDRNKMSLGPSAFGNRPLLTLSSTLYAAVAPTNVPPHGAPTNEGEAEMGSEDVRVNPSASLNERLDKGLPSNHDLEVPAHLEGLYNKHKDLYTSEVDVALSTFGQVMKAVQAKRMAALLVDVHVASVASGNFTIPWPLSFAQPAAAVAPQDGQAKEPSPINVPKKQSGQADSPNKVQEDAAVENVVMEAGDKGLNSSCGQSSKDRAACNERCVSK